MGLKPFFHFHFLSCFTYNENFNVYSPSPQRGCEQGVGRDENTINLFIIDSTEKSTFKHRVESKHPLKRAELGEGEVSPFKGESAVKEKNSQLDDELKTMH